MKKTLQLTNQAKTLLLAAVTHEITVEYFLDEESAINVGIYMDELFNEIENFFVLMENDAIITDEPIRAIPLEYEIEIDGGLLTIVCKVATFTFEDATMFLGVWSSSEMEEVDIPKPTKATIVFGQPGGTLN